jgi:lysophospholipase L1-like esterase
MPATPNGTGLLPRRSSRGSAAKSDGSGARAAPSRLAVVFLPSAALFDAGRPEHARAVARANQIRSTLVAMSAEEGTPYFDGLSFMAEQPNLDRLYFTVDSHPNPDGNRVLAGAVASFLIRRVLAPGLMGS